MPPRNSLSPWSISVRVLAEPSRDNRTQPELIQSANRQSAHELSHKYVAGLQLHSGTQREPSSDWMRRRMLWVTSIVYRADSAVKTIEQRGHYVLCRFISAIYIAVGWVQSHAWFRPPHNKRGGAMSEWDDYLELKKHLHSAIIHFRLIFPIQI